MTRVLVTGSVMVALLAVRGAVTARRSCRSVRYLGAKSAGADLGHGSETPTRPPSGVTGVGWPSMWRPVERLRASDPFGRAGRRRADALPSMADDIAGALRSGSSVAAALREVAEGPVNPATAQLRIVVARIQGGEPVGAALHRWADRADPDVGLLVAALSLGADAGGSRARSVERVTATLRERRALDSEVRALSSTARASAAVMVLAPLAFTAFVAVADPRTAAFLFTEPVGWACAVVGIVLDIAGAAWMARITGGRR